MTTQTCWPWYCCFDEKIKFFVKRKQMGFADMMREEKLIKSSRS